MSRTTVFGTPSIAKSIARPWLWFECLVKCFHLAGLVQAVRLPDLWSYVNFALWTFCTATAIVYFRIGAHEGSRALFPVGQGNAVMQLGLGALFAYGVSFYQRGSHRDALAPIVDV